MLYLLQCLGEKVNTQGLKRVRGEGRQTGGEADEGIFCK